MIGGAQSSARAQRDWSVYMVRCSDDSLYTGVTNDIERRVLEHNNAPVVGAYCNTPLQGCLVNLSIWRFSDFIFFNVFKSRAGEFLGLKIFGDYIYVGE